MEAREGSSALKTVAAMKAVFAVGVVRKVLATGRVPGDKLKRLCSVTFAVEN